MTRIFSFLLWAAVFLLIVVAIDQLLVRVPASSPAHVAVATFYRDLRVRVVDLVRGKVPSPAPAPVTTAPQAKEKGQAPAPSPTIEKVIGQSQVQSSPAAKSPVAKESTPRYVYADQRGELHFAETLAEVPAEYRGQAKRLGE